MKYALLGLVILTVAGVWYAIRKPAISNYPETTTPSTPTIVQQAKERPSRYAEFEDGIIEQNLDKRRVLFFYAAWCPTCRPVDTELEVRASEIPEDVMIIRVNYNDPDTDPAEKGLAKKYGVTYQHTFVQLDDQANEIAKWNGGDMDMILRNLR